MIRDTVKQYQSVIAFCRELFDKKHQDYGSAWRILRLSSVTDQIFIKAKRIRSLQELKTSKIDESEESEFVAIINYCLVALMQIDLGNDANLKLSREQVLEHYDRRAAQNLELLVQKNHDYGEAWRDMLVSSMTDLILMKIFRIKQIEDNQGETLVSEGVESIYQDILNYAVFCLIKKEFHHADNQ